MEKWMMIAFVCIVAFNFVQLLYFGRTWDMSPVDGRRLLGRPIPLFDFVPVIDDVRPMEDAYALKPWPTTPSFQPWTRNPDLKPFTCEAYFGNGFTLEKVFLESAVTDRIARRSEWSEERDSGGTFRCFQSETLRTSICEGTKMVMDVKKITMGKGGEEIDDVVGRDENEELPVFEQGAFQVRRGRDTRPNELLIDEVEANLVMPQGQVGTHTMRSLLLNLETTGAGEELCSQVVREPTLILTRFEYANLFHTVTDWFSAYISARVAGLEFRPRLLLLDGHCKSPMDDGWKAMFSSVTYAKHFPGRVCFDHAIFAPLGYDVPLFKHLSNTLGCLGGAVEDLKALPEADRKHRTARLREFGEFFVASFDGIHDKNATAKESSVDVGRQVRDVNVLFVRREDYMAHPRHSGRPESRLSNEVQVYDKLKLWAVDKSTSLMKVKIVNGLLAHMPLADQVQALRNADILVGAHGAGLTHLVFARPSTVVLELLSPFYKRPHFATLSHWMGLDYRVINMDSSVADTDEVCQRMSEILRDLK